MVHTVSQLASDVLGVRLGVVDIMKAPTAQQLARVTRLYNQKYAELAAEDKVYWESDAIPDIMVGALSRIIAEEMCPGLGMPVPMEMDEGGRAVSIGTKGYRMLHKLLARSVTGLPTSAEYF